MDRFYTIDDLTALLHVKRSTIYAWTHYRKIPHIKVGKNLLFDRQEIAAWLESKHVDENPTRATETDSKRLSA